MFAVYGACKAAMLSFTRTMAVELAEYGIRSNAVAPDWVRTPGNSVIWRGRCPVSCHARPRSAWLATSRRMSPLGGEGLDTRVRRGVAFLCSPAASYVNGATVARRRRYVGVQRLDPEADGDMEPVRHRSPMG